MLRNSIRTRKWVQSLILLMLGLYFLDDLLSGHIYYYINERFGWLSWIAMGIFLTLGLIGVADLLRTRRSGPEVHDHDHGEAEHEHHHEPDHQGHDHEHGSAPSWRILALVALPLVLGLATPPKPLGASAIGTSGISTSYSGIQGSGGGSTQLTMASTERNVLDWVRAFNNSNNVNEFNGQSADVIGFVYRDVRFKDPTQFMVARFIVSCCVADASALGVTVQADGADKLVQDSWVHIKGKFVVQTLDGTPTPVLVADVVEPTNQPDHPYLYP